VESIEGVEAIATRVRERVEQTQKVESRWYPSLLRSCWLDRPAPFSKNITFLVEAGGVVMANASKRTHLQGKEASIGSTNIIYHAPRLTIP
jgi:hypothetical protein